MTQTFLHTSKRFQLLIPLQKYAVRSQQWFIYSDTEVIQWGVAKKVMWFQEVGDSLIVKKQPRLIANATDFIINIIHF